MTRLRGHLGFSLLFLFQTAILVLYVVTTAYLWYHGDSYDLIPVDATVRELQGDTLFYIPFTMSIGLEDTLPVLAAITVTAVLLQYLEFVAYTRRYLRLWQIVVAWLLLSVAGIYVGLDMAFAPR